MDGLKIRIKFVKYTTESKGFMWTITPDLLLEKLNWSLKKERDYGIFDPQVLSAQTISNYEIIVTLNITGKDKHDNQLRGFILDRIIDDWSWNAEVIAEII
ncbi:hypothetical protein [Bacillus bombysepticus]|uniref:hypothetical protein n=1 Tax=Bacillus bombysepticus TaxID=658666 RepID=UPI00301801C7